MTEQTYLFLKQTQSRHERNNKVPSEVLSQDSKHLLHFRNVEYSVSIFDTRFFFALVTIPHEVLGLCAQGNKNKPEESIPWTF